MLKKILLFLLLIIGLCLSLAINSSLHSRDVALISIHDFAPYQPQYEAEDFCKEVLKKNYGEIHCGTINPEYIATLDMDQKDKVKTEVQLALDANTKFLAIIKKSSSTNDQFMDLSLIAEKKVEKLKEIIGNLNNEKLITTNADLFTYLLVAQGKTYNEYTNTFKDPSQSITRFIINPSNIQNKLKRLGYMAKHFSFYFLFTFLITFLLLRNFSLLGKLFSLTYLILGLIGLNIVRDASLHFGFESGLFSLNPFAAIFERQVLISFLSIILFWTCISKAELFGSFFEKILNKISISKVTLFSSFITIGSYLSFGPSLGSETFKISVRIVLILFLAALITLLLEKQLLWLV
jgi:hypothetical protein